MTKQNAIKVFEEKKVRTVWDSDKEEWYFSIVDVDRTTQSSRCKKLLESTEKQDVQRGK